ncbi:MAG: M48 family metallopeptidase [Kiritimatiellia bacterium]
MNFFDYQDRARKWTRLLAVLYALAVVLIVVAVYAVVVLVFSNVSSDGQHSASLYAVEPARAASGLSGLWDPVLFCWSMLVTLAILIGGTFYKVAELSGGGAVVARLMGGQPVAMQTADPDEQRLRNVVEEMAIASGTPVPQIFILSNETGINAFAAGLTTNDAAIAVTRGALQTLTRDELQGVIAHEFSHILNADMRMNVRLMGILHGILMIALTGYGLMRIVGRVRTGRGKSGGFVAMLFLLGLAVMIIGYIGVFFANLIKAAIGREREYLADASAAQFTRNPLGLAGALKKIAAWRDGGRVDATQSAAASHFFISEPGAASWMNFLETHPPLAERIRRLDPSFTGNLQAVQRALATVHVSHAAHESSPVPVDRCPPAQPSSRTAVSGLTSRVGAPDFPNVAYAAALLQAIPQNCRQAVATIEGAATVLYALLLSKRPDPRQRQMARLAARAPGNVYARLSYLADLCGAMPEASRLPLADLAVSSLRSLDAMAYGALRGNLMDMVLADEEVDPFEFALLHMVSRRLDRHFNLTQAPRVRFQSFDGLGRAMASVFSLLVWNGANDEAAAAAAYTAGWEALGETAVERLRDRKDCSLSELEEHLDRLAELAPQLKGQLLAACAAIVVTDGHTTLHEAETLRAIADALDCPVPPFAPDAVA